ncbi:MAG: DUF2232 domain-containing protein [Proteobacteria bacterium]|nr:DUF2232 domain-containing protein [Pseudomonadota bacterium]
MRKFFELMQRFFSSIPGKGFTSSILLLSSFFAVFSAAPAVTTYVGESRQRGLLVLVIGAGLTFLLGGVPAGVIYIGIVLFSTVVMGEFIRAKISFGKTLVISSVIIIGVYAIAVVVYSSSQSLGVMDLFTSKIMFAINFMKTNYPDVIKQTLIETGMSEKELALSIATKIPAIMTSVVMVFLFINMLIVGRYDEKMMNFLKFENLMKFKMPEYFVWPAIVCGGIYLYSTTTYNNSVNSATIDMIGLFLFKGIMTIYFLYGLMVVYVVTSIKIPAGFFRAALFSVIIVFAYIFVAAVGFFDTWFDFRKYFNKKGEEEL